jgi:uncharacterized membrane protein
VSTFQWLLALHVTGAFLLVGGAVVAGVLNLLALRRERPSEIALLIGLIRRVSVPAIGLGAVLTLVLGLWLVHHRGYSYGAFWVWATIVLWIVGNALGGRGGKKSEEARRLAVRLTAEGDAPSAELHAALRDPASNAMSWGAGLAFLLALVLMIWKPGS